MKNILIAGALVSTAALGACSTLTPANLSATVAAYEAEVQADTNLVCGFIPTVGTILSLIPAIGTVEPAAAAIADALCTAISKAPVPVASARLKSLAAGVPATVGNLTVSGIGVKSVTVPIVGTFTR